MAKQVLFVCVCIVLFVQMQIVASELCKINKGSVTAERTNEIWESVFAFAKNALHACGIFLFCFVLFFFVLFCFVLFCVLCCVVLCFMFCCC